MHTLTIVLAIWVAVSVPVALAVGAFLAGPAPSEAPGHE